MGSIASVWDWLSHVPFLGWGLLVALAVWIGVKALFLWDGIEQYRNGR